MSPSSGSDGSRQQRPDSTGWGNNDANQVFHATSLNRAVRENRRWRIRMNKILMGIVIGELCIASQCLACDAERITLIPGIVQWATGCCDNGGRSWVEIRGRHCLHHSSKFDGFMLFGGIAGCIAGGAWTIRRKIRKTANQASRATSKPAPGAASLSRES